MCERLAESRLRRVPGHLPGLGVACMTSLRTGGVSRWMVRRRRRGTAGMVLASMLRPSRPWIPRVELTGGKSFWIYSFDCGPRLSRQNPKKAATVEEVRALG